MFTATPKSWFSWNFRLCEAGGSTIGELHLSGWRERGSILAGGVEYRIYRESFLGPFLMEAPDGSLVGRAVKTNSFRRKFVVSNNTCSLVLKAVSPFRRECGVYRGEHRIGSIVPGSCLSRRASVEFADEVSLELQAFFTWLALLLWKREAEAAAA